MTRRVPPGTAFAPFHWGALHLAPGATALNAVTANHVDPVSLQPELKACAVRVEAVSPAARPVRARRRLVVVGAGMAAMATVEALLAHSDEFAITLIGREAAAPYNRVLLSKALSRGVEDERLALKPPEWFAAHGVELRLGVAARRLDRAAREVELDDGARVPYDELLLATGSAPWIPPGLRGLERAHVFRTLDDMRAIRAAAGGVRRAAVIGGGLLGLEAARGLRELGAAVTVVHLADRLMELQLDTLAARLLERRIRALGIDVLCGRRTEAITEEGVVLADGATVSAELVVLATGIRPEVALARDAGLEVGRGVLVDDALRASAPGVWAVGECAEHRGTVYGLWAPVLEQAGAAGAALAGRPAAFHGAVPATTLKVAGVDLFCAGRAAEPDERAEEVLALDSRRERYRKLVLRDGRLAGATLLGDLADARELRGLIASARPVPEALLDRAPSQAREPDSLVCSCRVVSRSEILATGLKTVEAIAEKTGAGTGCGGCRPDVASLIRVPAS